MVSCAMYITELKYWHSTRPHADIPASRCTYLNHDNRWHYYNITVLYSTCI